MAKKKTPPVSQEDVRRSTRKKTTVTRLLEDDESSQSSSIASSARSSQESRVKRKIISPTDSSEDLFAKPTAKSTKKNKKTAPPKKDKEIKTPASVLKAAGDKRKKQVISSPMEGSSQSSNSTISTPQAFEYIVREIFTQTQHAHNMAKCLEKLDRAFTGVAFPVFYHEFARNVRRALQMPEKSPYTKNVLEFIAKFLVRRWRIAQNTDTPAETPAEPDSDCDELGLEGLGRASICSSSTVGRYVDSIVDTLLSDVLVSALNAEMPAVRSNTCILIRKILVDVNDIETDVYTKLKVALINRMADKVPGIRANTAKTLHRFQDTEDTSDPVLSAFEFHLKSDPDADVRQAVVCAIVSNEEAKEVVMRTRDIKPVVRKAAYMKIANAVKIDDLSIEQRLNLIRDGLNDRHESVRKTVEKNLIKSWLHQCSDNLMELLGLLDLQDDTQTAELLMNTIYTSFMRENIPGGKTKLHLFVENFIRTHLDQRKVLIKAPLAVENGFVWRTLATFCHKNAEQIAKMLPVKMKSKNDEHDSGDEEIDEMMAKVRIPDEQAENEEEPIVDPDAEHTPPKQAKKVEVLPEEELYESLIPDLPHFCHYIMKFAKKLNSTDDHITTDVILDYEFIYLQLCQIMLLIPIRDDAQRNILIKTVHDIVFMTDLQQNITDGISPLMKVLALNVFKSSSELLKFTQELTQEVHNSVLSTDEPMTVVAEEAVASKAAQIDPRKLAELEQDYCRIALAIEVNRDDLDECLNKKEFLKANEFKIALAALQKDKEENMRQRFELSAKSTQVASQEGPSSQTPEEKAPEGISDHPAALLKCLQIFSASLEYSNAKEVDTFIQSHIDKIVFAGLMSVESVIRRLAVRALGLCCLVHPNPAREYLLLFLQALQHDEVNVKLVALQSIFDLLCEHGLEPHVTKTPAKIKEMEKRDAERLVAEEAHISMTEDDTAEESPVAVEDDNSMDYETFQAKLTELISEHLNNDDDSLKYVAVVGVGKLMVLNRVFAPALLTKLLIMWYDENTSSKIKHFLGVFFPFFAYKTNREYGVSGQAIFEECFLDTIEAAYTTTLPNDEDTDEEEANVMTSADVDNLINFMVVFITEEAKVRCFATVIGRILELLANDSYYNGTNLVNKHLVKALTALPLNAATKRQLKEIKGKLHEVKTAMQRLDKPVALNIKRVEKVLEKVDANLEKLREGGEDSQLDIEDENDKTVIEGAAAGEQDDVESLTSRKGNNSRLSMTSKGAEDDEDATSDNEFDYTILNKSLNLDTPRASKPPSEGEAPTDELSLNMGD